MSTEKVLCCSSSTALTATAQTGLVPFVELVVEGVVITADVMFREMRVGSNSTCTTRARNEPS